MTMKFLIKSFVLIGRKYEIYSFVARSAVHSAYCRLKKLNVKKVLPLALPHPYPPIR